VHRPSPSLLVSFVALFVALGGTSYAISQLPPNSVGNKQLRASAVTSSKIKDRTITSKDLAVGTVLKGATGPQGPQGAAGSQGPQGAAGPQGGTARAYGYVKADGTLDSARSSANVAPPSKPTPGRYCITISGLSPSTAVMLVDPDFDTDSTSPATATKAFAEPRSNSNGCQAGQWYVQTMKLTIGSPGSLALNDEPFFFAVP
jgi:hypothetical protein